MNLAWIFLFKLNQKLFSGCWFRFPVFHSFHGKVHDFLEYVLTFSDILLFKFVVPCKMAFCGPSILLLHLPPYFYPLKDMLVYFIIGRLFFLFLIASFLLFRKVCDILAINISILLSSTRYRSVVAPDGWFLGSFWTWVLFLYAI